MPQNTPGPFSKNALLPFVSLAHQFLTLCHSARSLYTQLMTCQKFVFENSINILLMNVVFSKVHSIIQYLLHCSKHSPACKPMQTNSQGILINSAFLIMVQMFLRGILFTCYVLIRMFKTHFGIKLFETANINVSQTHFKLSCIL